MLLYPFYGRNIAFNTVFATLFNLQYFHTIGSTHKYDEVSNFLSENTIFAVRNMDKREFLLIHISVCNRAKFLPTLVQIMLNLWFWQ